MTTSVGYASSSHFGVHFGTGQRKQVGSIEIRWPSGIRPDAAECQDEPGAAGARTRRSSGTRRPATPGSADNRPGPAAPRRLDGQLIRAEELEMNAAVLIDRYRVLEQRDRFRSLSGLQQCLAQRGARRQQSRIAR